jgi:hypothetical protein
MGRKKINLESKNQSVSISLTPDQKRFVLENKKFDFSKFTQLHLQEYINFCKEVEFLEKKLKINRKEVIL